MSAPRHEKRVLYTDQPQRGVDRFNQALKFTQIPMGYPSLAFRLGPQAPMTPPRLRIRCALAALNPRLRVASQSKLTQQWPGFHHLLTLAGSGRANSMFEILATQTATATLDH
jgi:hypothetical protein